jgi:hypothetical protein
MMGNERHLPGRLNCNKEKTSMSIDYSMKISVPKHVLVRVFENESVILNLDTESYHGLDDVGSSMWKALTHTSSIQEAYEALLPQYEVEPAQLRQDLDDFLEKLRQRGMVEFVAG